MKYLFIKGGKVLMNAIHEGIELKKKYINNIQLIIYLRPGRLGFLMMLISPYP